MNNAQRDIRRKKRVLEHAARVGNVRKTCRYFGVARSGFYVWKKAYETHGDESDQPEAVPVQPETPHAPRHRREGAPMRAPTRTPRTVTTCVHSHSRARTAMRPSSNCS